MLQSWFKLVNGGIQAANMEYERLMWELDEVISAIKSKAIEIANRYGRYSPIWRFLHQRSPN